MQRDTEKHATVRTKIRGIRRLVDALWSPPSRGPAKEQDPARLFCQFNALFPGRFAWEYLDSGLARTAAAESDER